MVHQNLRHVLKTERSIAKRATMVLIWMRTMLAWISTTVLQTHARTAALVPTKSMLSPVLVPVGMREIHVRRISTNVPLVPLVPLVLVMPTLIVQIMLVHIRVPVWMATMVVANRVLIGVVPVTTVN